MNAASLDAVHTGRASAPAAYRDEDFPGCVSFHLPASEVDHYEGRLEFWDGATETAWKIPETPIQHEWPSRNLTQKSARLEMLRGSPILSLGSSDADPQVARPARGHGPGAPSAGPTGGSRAGRPAG